MEELFSIHSFELKDFYQNIEHRLRPYLPYLYYIFPCLGKYERNPHYDKDKGFNENYLHHNTLRNNTERDFQINKNVMTKLIFEIENKHRHRQYLDTFHRKLKVIQEMNQRFKEDKVLEFCEWETIL